MTPDRHSAGTLKHRRSADTLHDRHSAELAHNKNLPVMGLGHQEAASQPKGYTALLNHLYDSYAFISWGLTETQRCSLI